MSNIHLDILDTTRKQVFNQLSSFSSFGYLAGGTALALQLNHRKSVNFDIFVNKEITNTLRLEVKRLFGDVPYEINTGDQITFYAAETV